ncbi:1,4-alpha-glucan branching protein GlgB [Alcaligenaceae bacterium]|nr:1,4-alpha-glucan branching protein GlgB [Alcaligenaceae bacterium]
MTTRQSASLAVYGEVERGKINAAPQSPPHGGGEAPADRPEFFTARSPLLGELDLYLIGEGRHWDLADCLGAHIIEHEGRRGTRFAVWAPNASRVSVVGDFNDWDDEANLMYLHSRNSGVWEAFVPAVGAGARYKYALRGSDGRRLPLKADPLARQAEPPPATASVVADDAPFIWTDDEWMRGRAGRQAPEAPLSIYEVHFGSWRRPEGAGGGGMPHWRGMGAALIRYAVEMGYTHIELLPITEHPFGGSWGYQPLGLFAPTARHGTPAEFAAFVDACHAAGIGVILDWVPAHFPADEHGLVRFDGTALYEHEDPRQGFHPDWNTLIYNFGRHEVSNLLLASALEWTRRYHVDGLRVDAVASMLYLDYSREAGQWRPNVHGGRENLDAVAFLQTLNTLLAEQAPGAMVIAEESTAWPGVTAATRSGGLGFQYKWNMGWMHDTLRYMGHEPIHRRYHHHDMTFGTVYAWSERFILPLSHDEVVHGKGSLLGRMPGDDWRKFANLRAYFGFMWGHPGKKLLFMGGDIAQWSEWNHDGEVDWQALGYIGHAGVQAVIRDLNAIYRRHPALHAGDARPDGFAWLIGDDVENSVFAFLRSHGHQHVLVACNMTPVPRTGYRVGVPRGGLWREILNTDASVYGGSGMGNGGSVQAADRPSHGRPHSVSLVLPPLATLMLVPADDGEGGMA